jgi:hypothetical protein
MDEQHPLMKFFSYSHLPPHLQPVSKPFYELALEMSDKLPTCEEKDFAMRKLLEAKDCAVRANLAK